MIESFDFSTFAFIVFTILTLGGAFGVVTNRNLFRGTIWLMISLFGVAGYFVLLSAPFLAAVQVLVYIGAIAILFTFAVMLTRSLTNIRERYQRVWPTALSAAAFFILLVVTIVIPVFGIGGVLEPDMAQVLATPVARTVDLGEVLVSGNGFVLPFEVASLLLTAAMIGAIVIARDADREVE